MTEEVLQDVIRILDGAAHGASVAEEKFRREALDRIAGLERERIFAFRRLNLMKAVIEAMSAAEDHPVAIKHATSALLREVNWNGASESQREAIEKFLPVANAVWEARQDDREKDGEESVMAVERQLAAFEAWFERNRNAAFLSLMDREPLELPLVEV